MIRLGIVGAENSHSYLVAKACNSNPSVGMKVVAIWGETPELAQASATKGDIPKMVADWRELLGQVDVVMIDHRHAGNHYEPAEFFLNNDLPVFVDKPFTFTTDEARRLLDLAESHHVPITTFSIVPRQQVFQEFKKKVEESGTLIAVNSTGPADIESKHGGIFFYGIHQVEALVELLGTEAETVLVKRQGKNAHAFVQYSGGRWGTMNLISGPAPFQWMVCTEKESLTYRDGWDPDPYLVTAQLINRLVSEKKNLFSRERMFAPVAILEAMAESLRTGREAKVLTR